MQAIETHGGAAYLAKITAPHNISKAERDSLRLAPVTLNNHPARLAQGDDRFVTVEIKETGLCAVWSWPAAARIIAAGGHFRS